MMVEIEESLKELDGAIIQYEIEISLISDHSQEKPWRAKLETYKSQAKDLECQLERFRNREEEQKPEVIKEAMEMTEKQAVKQVAKIGDAIQRDSMKTAKNILGMIHESQDVVKDINKEILEQNAKLLESEEIIKDSQSALARASKLVDYFDRAFAKDIFLKIMLGLIALAIIGVIVFSCISKGESKKAAQLAQAKAAISTGSGVVNCATAGQAPDSAAASNTGKVRCVELSESLDPVMTGGIKPGMETPPSVTPTPAPAPKRILRVADSENPGSE